MGQDTATTWLELWDELHHQGDVGDASYAAIPYLVKIHRERGVVDWNTYELVAIVELARTEKQNPGLPGWLEEDYFHAIDELAKISATEVLRAEGPEAVRAILGVIAIAKGLRTHGKFLVEYSDDELLDMELRE